MEVTESKAEYWSEFTDRVNQIQSSLDTPSLIVETLSEIKNQISLLQIFATSNNEILPKYDVRRSQEVRLDIILHLDMWIDSFSHFLSLSHTYTISH